MDKDFLLYNADSYLLFENLKSKELIVNHIITDPPYNISKSNNFGTMKNPRTGVDFGSWDRGKFDLFSWIPLYTQLLEQNGSIIIFCSYRFISYITDVLESEECNCIVKDILIWQKLNPMPRNINRRYVQDLEFAIWAVKKNAKWVFNKPENKSYLRSIYSASVVNGKEKLGHPTQKSLSIMKDIISVHTNENEIILDPFMGSGTTGEAALLLGRKFIGIEKEIDFFEMSKKRMEKYL